MASSNDDINARIAALLNRRKAIEGEDDDSSDDEEDLSASWLASSHVPTMPNEVTSSQLMSESYLNPNSHRMALPHDNDWQKTLENLLSLFQNLCQAIRQTTVNPRALLSKLATRMMFSMQCL